MIMGLESIPVFTAAISRSSLTELICAIISWSGIMWILWTPRVFWAVMAVTAVAAYPPWTVILLISAWIPAPPDESEPAIDKTTGLFIFWSILMTLHFAQWA